MRCKSDEKHNANEWIKCCIIMNWDFITESKTFVRHGVATTAIVVHFVYCFGFAISMNIPMGCMLEDFRAHLYHFSFPPTFLLRKKMLQSEWIAMESLECILKWRIWMENGNHVLFKCFFFIFLFIHILSDRSRKHEPPSHIPSVRCCVVRTLFKMFAIHIHSKQFRGVCF